jgi:hypothetical protein
MSKIGLAITTNKLEEVALKYVPYSTKVGIDECAIVHHCHEDSALSEAQIEKYESQYSTESTNLRLRSSTRAFHEARNETFALLTTDIQVKWDDDHVFSRHDGHILFKERLLSSIERFGGGIFYFQIPTFGVHPRLLTKSRILCGLNGDVFAFTKKDAEVSFCEDSKYSDRQVHKGTIKHHLGNLGVLHLDQMKPFKYLAYRGHLNGKLRNFNIQKSSLEDAWKSTFSQPIEDTIRREIFKMKANPSEYFVRAPEHWVDQLPQPLYEMRNSSVRDFRYDFFGEDLGLEFSLDSIPLLSVSDLNIQKRIIYTDF